MQVTVRDLMTSQPLLLSELATVEEATRRILERAVGEAYVVDDDGRLLGTVSDFALLKARILLTDAQEPASRFMSRNMLLLKPDMRLDQVTGYFRESCYPRLAVVENGRVVGQLSRRDVLRAMVVIEEIALASVDDDFETSLSVSNTAVSPETGLIHRLESPAATVLPEPACLRSTPELDSSETVRSMSSLATG